MFWLCAATASALLPSSPRLVNHRASVQMLEGEAPVRYAPPKKRFLGPGSKWPGSQSLVREHMTEKLVTLSPTQTLKE